MCTAAVPFPLSDCTVGEFDALLENVSVPFTCPVACGVNVTVKSAVSPAGIVTGQVIPLRVNAPLLKTQLLTVTLVPVALSEAGRLELLPNVTLPKFKLDGVTANCPVCVPVPERGIIRLGFDASEVMVKFPLTLPADCGVKTTLKEVFPPAGIVSGKFSPVTLNPVPLTPSCVMVASDPPVLVKVSGSV